MAVSDETMIMQNRSEEQTVASMILEDVYHALEEKGYNPINQIVGYLLSGDPTYITTMLAAISGASNEMNSSKN